jgi:hypothetical protein
MTGGRLAGRSADRTLHYASAVVWPPENSRVRAYTPNRGGKA